MSSREGAPSFEEDDDCTCCDTFCDFICGNDEEEDCACCLRCCSCIPGCEKGATPSCGIAGIDGWCVRRDFCGLICAGISVTVILMTHATVVTFIITPFFRWSTWGWIHLILFSSVVFLAFSSHLVCMTTSPGVMPRGVVSAEELAAQGDLPRSARGVVRICTKCMNYKLKGVHHCSICNLCVERMDHHCPWVNNCVGRFNQKYFVLFLGYVALGETYGLALFLFRAGWCSAYPELARCGRGNSPDAAESILSTFATITCVLVAIISALFLAFVCCIGCEQWEGIRDDMPKIDRLQKKSGPGHDGEGDNTCYEGTAIVCGEEWGWRWLLPLPGGHLINHRAQSHGFHGYGNPHSPPDAQYCSSGNDPAKNKKA